jgi:hypothetical protein
MKRFVEGQDRAQSTLFPECLEDWIGEDNPVRAIDVFVEELDLADNPGRAAAGLLSTGVGTHQRKRWRITACAITAGAWPVSRHVCRPLKSPLISAVEQGCKPLLRCSARWIIRDASVTGGIGGLAALQIAAGLGLQAQGEYTIQVSVTTTSTAEYQ